MIDSKSGFYFHGNGHVIKFGNLFKKRSAAFNEEHLALYMGYAFSHAIHVQHLVAPGELMVPYVVYWDGETPTPVPYPAPTQHEAVANAVAARERASGVSGWSSGRDAEVTQQDGAKVSGLLISGKVPGLDVPLELFVYYRTEPFRLIGGFMWKVHAQARKDAQSFMADFKRGILMQPFGQRSLDVIEKTEHVQLVR